MNEEVKRDHEWHEKVWGSTRCLVRSPFYFRYELDVIKDSFCSFHYHERRANRFFVESGVLKVVWLLGTQLHSQVLLAGDRFDVCSLTAHQFQVLDGGTIYEEYFPDRGGEIKEDDIVRIWRGGWGSKAMRLNRPVILREDGRHWEGGLDWILLPSSE